MEHRIFHRGQAVAVRNCDTADWLLRIFWGECSTDSSRYGVLSDADSDGIPRPEFWRQCVPAEDVVPELEKETR